MNTITKSIILTFLILFMISCQKGEKTIERCNLVTEKNISKSNGKIFTGSCNIYSNDTILLKTLTYKRGDLRKEVTYYPSTNQIEYIGNRRNGIIQGDFKSFYRNGIMSIEGELDKGRYIGEWNYYDDDGSLNKTLNYDKNGALVETINFK